MSDFVNPATVDLRLSVNDMPAPWIECTRAQYEAWSVIPQRYRKWVTDHIEEMTQAEKDAVDLAALDAARDSTIQQLDQQEDILRAFAGLLVDELNAHTARTNALLDAIDASNTLAALKTAAGQIANLPTRDLAALRQAIRNKIGS